MKKVETVRVRFAPSPTGFMHLGNVRAALVNYLFAKQQHGVFVLRIEDTDQQRLIDPHGAKIIDDLHWLGLEYQEGPLKNGPHAPYYQSQRSTLYQEYLEIFKQKNVIYRCFCTTQELEKKRQRQIALKQPPRYDRTCTCLSEAEITQKLDTATPFIWRFKLDADKSVTFYDLARKTVTFELKHFSDFAITRQDGSHTFMFANFVDDVTMQITHVFRGEDHLTNTADQVAMYDALGVKIPVFWHLPIMGNTEGKKLSKRDFGFSLTDLKTSGFVPEAICNYLAIIGGGTFTKEIMTPLELIEAINFETISSTGQIRYDLEKLRWVNHQWLRLYSVPAVTALCFEYLKDVYPSVTKMSTQELETLISYIKEELVTLQDCVAALAFYFDEPVITPELLENYNFAHYRALLSTLIPEVIQQLDNPDSAVKHIQAFCKAKELSVKDIFTLLRVVLTGQPKGPTLKELIHILGTTCTQERLQKLI